MEHFMDYYDSFLDITIPCHVTAHDNCCVGSDDDFFDKHGYEHDDFLGFPGQHGWTVNPSTYHLQLAEPQPSGSKIILSNAEEFIQSWLFFCLITCIVRTDKPLLKFKDLISDSVTRAENTVATNLRTKKLKKALASWHQWADQNRQEAKLRLIQSDLILELGRQVVRANLAEGRTRTSKLGISPKTSLAIMILGETLSTAKLEIMESTGTKVRGWHEDDNEGWGGSEFVSSEIRKLKFCPHVEKMLKVQMGSNATLLLAATKHYPGVPYHGAACENAQNCIYMSAANTATLPNWISDNGTTPSLYRPQCHKIHDGLVEELCQRGACSMVGPNMDHVYKILSKVDDNDEGSEFPLFRIQMKPTEIVVMVEKWSRAGQRPDFATISHVWSQGLGNEDKNEVHQCQLKHLAHLLELLQPPLGNTRTDASPLFWLDTFAIPVRPKAEDSSPRVPGNFDDLKKRSIRQIRHVYDSSTHSIIIDKDLCSYEAGNRPIKVAMRLLTSSWMRRLWTLQEAFLSKKISIACQPDHSGSADQQADPFPGWDFEKLMENLVANGKNVEPHKSTLSMSGILIRQLRDNLMISEREVRNRPGDPDSTKGSILIASAWRSVRWRVSSTGPRYDEVRLPSLPSKLSSTSRQEDETLALATLLNLDYRETDISKAGGMRRFEPGSNEAMKQRQEMMKEFWQLIHQHWEGSIPSGMIFLPPPRLSIPGFGWSPETWMTGKTEDYPYPLARMDYPTDLKREGLIVRYPGVILYSSNFASRLANLGTGVEGFDFPVDRELNEWYSVSAIENPSMDVVQASNNDTGNPKAPKRFALIMSRPRPKDRKEVALLVEIYGSPRRRKEGKAPYDVYQCWIISRVWVRRGAPQKLSSFGVIGELTDENQRWCVDDYKPRAEQEKSRVVGTAMPVDTRGNEPNGTFGTSTGSSKFANFFSFNKSATWAPTSKGKGPM